MNDEKNRVLSFFGNGLKFVEDINFTAEMALKMHNMEPDYYFIFGVHFFDGNLMEPLYFEPIKMTLEKYKELQKLVIELNNSPIICKVEPSSIQFSSSDIRPSGNIRDGFLQNGFLKEEEQF